VSFPPRLLGGAYEDRFGQRWARFEREGFEIIVLGFNIGAWTLAVRRIGMGGEIRVLKSYCWGPE
jgi:hypothetical protein